jgi:hypothetical protein
VADRGTAGAVAAWQVCAIVNRAWVYARRVVAGMLSAGLVAGLGRPAIVAVVLLAVLVLGVICWVIGDSARSERVTRMILARHGDGRCLARSPSASRAQGREVNRAARRPRVKRAGAEGTADG